MTYTVTYTKTITANNQEWSSDDSAHNLITRGRVNIEPDIQIVAGAGSGYGGAGVENAEYDGTLHSTGSTSYVLASTQTHSAVEGKALRLVESKYYHWGSGTLNGMWSRHYIKLTIQSTTYNGGVETTVWEHTHENSVNDKYTSTYVEDITIPHNEDMVLRFYHKRTPNYDITSNIDEIYTTSEEQLLLTSKNTQVYNTADGGVICDVSGLIHPGAIVRVNADASGTYEYSDDFDDNKFYYDTYNYVSAVFNTDKADISNNGYIKYIQDVKHPITGMPTITAQIDITAGTPTIQISSDGATWYDIDDAIVDNILTEYDLTSTGNLVLSGAVSFYFRIVCDGSAACSVKSFQIDANLDTSLADNPVMVYNATNTFRCNQNAISSMNCTVDLICEEALGGGQIIIC